MWLESKLKRAVILLVLMGMAVSQAPAEDRLQLRWDELAPVITGHRVWLPLKGGGRISGTVQAVESTGLAVEIVKTSDPKVYSKGLVSIPRSSVSTIQLDKSSGHKGIIIGSAVGGGIAAAAGGTLIAIRRNEGGTSGNGIIAAAIAGPVAIGVLVGWLSDRIAHHGGRRITVRAD